MGPGDAESTSLVTIVFVVIISAIEKAASWYINWERSRSERSDEHRDADSLPDTEAFVRRR